VDEKIAVSGQASAAELDGKTKPSTGVSHSVAELDAKTTSQHVLKGDVAELDVTGRIHDPVPHSELHGS